MKTTDDLKTMKRLWWIMVVLFAALIVMFAHVSSHAQTTELKKQRETMVATWNECGVSIDKENTLIQELTLSLQTHPPWRVVDARQPVLRAKLIDDIIAEHKRRIALLEKIKAADQ